MKDKSMKNNRRKGSGKSRMLAMLAAGWLSCLTGFSAFAGEALADSPVIDTKKTGTLTICKLRDNDARITLGNGSVQTVGEKPMAGIVFSVLRIGEITAVNDSGTMVTCFTGMDSGFLELLAANAISIGSKTVGETVCYSADDVSEALLAINRKSGSTPGEVQVRDYVKQHAATVVLPKTDASGKAAASGLPLGLYLVAETDASGYTPDPADPDTAAVGSDEVVSNPASPFLVSLPMTNQAAGGDAQAGTAWQYEVTVYPKDQTIHIPKFIVREKDGDTLQQAEDLEIGETVKQVIAPSVPAVEPTIVDEEGHKTIDRKYEVYRIRDTMQEGLRLQSSAKQIVVRLGSRIANPEKLSAFDSFATLQMGTDYTVTIAKDRRSFVIEFLDAGLERLNALQACGQVAVIFDSVLDAKASPKAGTAEAVTNQPELTWKNANATEASITGNQPGVYTYRLELRKKGLTDGSKASFGITRGGKPLSFAKEKEGVYHLWDNAGDTGTPEESIRPSAAGVLEIRGLDADSYVFTELSTEPGHELLKTPFTVALTAREPADGTLAKAELRVNGKTSALPIDPADRGCAAFTIENYPALVLRTGGPGLHAFEAAGLAMLALGLAIARRRRGAR